MFFVHQVANASKRFLEENSFRDSDSSLTATKNAWLSNQKAILVPAKKILALAQNKIVNRIIINHCEIGTEKPHQPYTYGSHSIKVDNQVYEKLQTFHSRKKGQFFVWRCKVDSCTSTLKTMSFENLHTILEAASKHQHGAIADSDLSDLENSSECSDDESFWDFSKMLPKNSKSTKQQISNYPDILKNMNQKIERCLDSIAM